MVYLGISVYFVLNVPKFKMLLSSALWNEFLNIKKRLMSCLLITKCLTFEAEIDNIFLNTVCASQIPFLNGTHHQRTRNRHQELARRGKPKWLSWLSLLPGS